MVNRWNSKAPGVLAAEGPVTVSTPNRFAGARDPGHTRGIPAARLPVNPKPPRLTLTTMSQTSPTPKAEPEVAASVTTPAATQTPTTSYTPSSWGSSRSYQHLDLGL